LSSVEFKESLLNVYYGEQFGEAFNTKLFAETDDDIRFLNEDNL
tara:strand:- start:718 stop:849 length:132 start_codon:yes stop_codon:yes gene_type:complete